MWIRWINKLLVFFNLFLDEYISGAVCKRCSDTYHPGCISCNSSKCLTCDPTYGYFLCYLKLIIQKAMCYLLDYLAALLAMMQANT